MVSPAPAVPIAPAPKPASPEKAPEKPAATSSIRLPAGPLPMNPVNTAKPAVVLPNQSDLPWTPIPAAAKLPK
jgi:hypothetical protein